MAIFDCAHDFSHHVYIAQFKVNERNFDDEMIYVYVCMYTHIYFLLKIW